jgi:hypothetical protein
MYQTPCIHEFVNVIHLHCNVVWVSDTRALFVPADRVGRGAQALAQPGRGRGRGRRAPAAPAAHRAPAAVSTAPYPPLACQLTSLHF